jgi:hypothetical protein
MEQSQLLKSYEWVDKHELVITRLPEKIQNKFQMLDELLDNYEQAESQDEEFNIKEKILACDTGLSNDLESYVMSMDKDKDNDDDDADKAQDEMKRGGEINDQNSNPDKPLWRFWM